MSRSEQVLGPYLSIILKPGEGVSHKSGNCSKIFNRSSYRPFQGESQLSGGFSLHFRGFSHSNVIQEAGRYFREMGTGTLE